MLPIPEAPSQEVELNEGPDKLLFDENEYIETHDYFEPSDFYNSGDDDDYMDEDSEEDDSEDDDEMSIDAVSENEIDDLQKRMRMINTNQLKITSLNCERTTNINGLKQLIENNDITLLQDLGKTTRSLLDIIQLPLTIIYSKLTAIVIHHKIDDLIKVTNQHTFELDPVAFPSDAVIRVNNKRKYHIINVYYPQTNSTSSGNL